MAAVDPELDPMCKELSEDDLPALLTILHGASTKWEQIAIFLRLGEANISTIKYTPHPDKRLLEVIRIWLKNTSPAPTVKSLAEALKNPVVGEEKIALDIKQTFCPHSESTRKF